MSDLAAVTNLEAALWHFVDRLGAVGVWVAMDVRGRPRIRVTAGHRSIGGAALDGSELYQIGSQTKTLVAIAILLLVRDGLIGLDDSAAALADIQIEPRITVRHLITNSSGLGEYTSGMAWPDIDPCIIYSPRELVTLAKSQGQTMEPGAAFDYCNTGWVVAAMIVDRLAPEGWPGFVRKRIFAPLDLSRSYIWGEAVPMPQMARGYLRLPRSPELFDTGEMGMGWAYGAGDAISCHDDMLDLYRALLAPQNPVGVTMADLTSEILQPSPHPRFALSLGAEYGYGVEGRAWGGRQVWGHPGRSPGYAASTWADPGNGVIVTTAYTNVWDATEAFDLAALRYNGPQLFTLALMTAYAVAAA
jgi:D-alanyl-D-alanine carboxypeptidase